MRSYKLVLVSLKSITFLLTQMHGKWKIIIFVYEIQYPIITMRAMPEYCCDEIANRTDRKGFSFKCSSIYGCYVTVTILLLTFDIV